MPQANALSRFTRQLPPAAVQLKRIAQYLGVPEPKPVHTSAKKTTAKDAIQEAHAAGLPVMEGRPDDPMLDLLDL